MLRQMLKSKISYARLTDCQLYYKGSISIDADILKAADLKEGEKVDVLNLNTGTRLQTYVIKAAAGSGEICLNGPAARMGYKGDKVVIISYAMFNERELENYKAKYVQVDEGNKIENTYLA